MTQEQIIEIWEYAMYWHISFSEAERLFKEGKI